jgi:hypothetical protein
MTVSIKELVESLKSIPVYQRKDVELAYCGQKVVWKLEFKSILDRKESWPTVLAFGPNDYPCVYFKIDLDKYPEFKLMCDDTKIIVTATIDSVSGSQINLKNVEKIEFTFDSNESEVIDSKVNEINSNTSIKNISFFQMVILHKNYSFLIVFIFLLIIYLISGISPNDLIP